MDPFSSWPISRVFQQRLQDLSSLVISQRDAMANSAVVGTRQNVDFIASEPPSHDWACPTCMFDLKALSTSLFVMADVM